MKMEHNVGIQVNRTQVRLKFLPNRTDIVRVKDEITQILKISFLEESLRKKLYDKTLKENFNVNIEVNYDGYRKNYIVLIASNSYMEMTDSIKTAMSDIERDIEFELLYSTLREPGIVMKLAG